MELEEILQQQVEIGDLFDHLVRLHKTALFGGDNDTGEQLSLNRIRLDIRVCLNDFNVLNNMLISFDGKIKQEIRSLEAVKTSVNNLKLRRKALLSQKEKWGYNSSKRSSKGSCKPLKFTQSDVIEIKTAYRHSMNEYIQLVGRNNTSLSSVSPDNGDQDPHMKVKEEKELTAQQTIEALRILDKSYTDIQQEIKSLTSLLDNMKKDATFLETERRQKFSFLKLQQHSIDRELGSIDANIKKLLKSCGFSLPSRDDMPMSQKLLHLSLYWDDRHNRKLEEENNDIIDHSDEFIDLKIKELKDQLTHRKDNSTNLIADKNLWNDCISNIEDLEDDLHQSLANGHTIDATRLIQKINVKITYLESSLAYTENEKIKNLINDEIEGLRMACSEVVSSNKAKNSSFQFSSKGKSNPVLSDVEISTQNMKPFSHANYSANKVAPFTVGKSPPKIGISEQNTPMITHTVNKKME